MKRLMNGWTDSGTHGLMDELYTPPPFSFTANHSYTLVMSKNYRQRKILTQRLKLGDLLEQEEPEYADPRNSH